MKLNVNACETAPSIPAMKSILFASLLLPSILFAQSPERVRVAPTIGNMPGFQAPASALPDNYQVTLTVTDKDSPPLEVFVVVASSQFNASLGEQNLAFSGSVTVEDAGSLVIAYSLGWETQITGAGGSIQSRTSSTQGSVRLKLDEEIQIIRAGSRTARLSIKKLEPAKPK